MLGSNIIFGPGILESDDIYLLTKEIEKAVEYSKICSDLVQKVIDKDNERRMVKENQLVRCFKRIYFKC